MVHEDRTRMEPDVSLTEPDPYSGDVEDTGQFRWRSIDEIEEWCYDQGYDSGIKPLWKYLGTDELSEIGEHFLTEGPEGTKYLVDEMVMETVDQVTDEYLETYVDGQMRLFAGYDVAENGDTLEEGEHGVWEDLRIAWEAGFRDKLRGNERYSSIQ